MGRTDRIVKIALWVVGGSALLVLASLFIGIGLLFLTLDHEVIKNPSWTQVHEALSDWPVRIAEVGRPLSLEAGRGLKDNTIELEIEMRNKRDVERLRQSLAQRESPKDRQCRWQGKETATRQLAKMPSCTDGDEWPWLLFSSEEASANGIVVRLRAVQPYD